MRYRKLDSNGDMVFGSGSNDFHSELDAVKQACKTRLLLLQNEWFENTLDGLPLFQQIAGHRDKELASRLIRDRIQGTRDVISATNVQTSFDNKKRGFSFSADVYTTYGTFTIDSENLQ